MLEFGAVSSRFFGESHEQFGSFKVAVVIRRDVGDEVRGLVWTHESAADQEVTHGLIVGA